MPAGEGRGISVILGFGTCVAQVAVGKDGRVRRILAMLVSSASAIRQLLQPSPASDTSAFNRTRALVNSLGGTPASVDQVIELGAFVRDQPHNVFLDGNLFRGHESHSALPAATMIQKTAWDSMR